jgi:nucleotide-binding universal stress UspA family protein
MKTLVAYDGSDSARRALDRAMELSGPGDDLHVLGVTAPARRAWQPNGPIDGSRRDPIEDALDEARHLLAESRAAWRVTRRRGDPETVLSEEVQQGYDLVFVGSRPLSGLERMLLGSVTSWVAHHATCDVVITR